MDDADAEAGSSRRHDAFVDAHVRSGHSFDAAAGRSSTSNRHGAASNSSSYSGTTSEPSRESLTRQQSTVDTNYADNPPRPDKTRRKRVHRPSSTFLLDSGGPRRSHIHRLSLPKLKSRPHPTASTQTRSTSVTDSLFNTPESLGSSSFGDNAMRIVSDPPAGKKPVPSPGLAKNPSTGSLDRSSPASSHNSHIAASAAVDVDSAQIVSMALSLCESRRLASRRNMSRTNPPKLIPLPDSTTTNDLRQQLKQQRLSSRSILSSPGQSMTSRQSTRLSVSSLPQSSLTPQAESHGYHFSSSTLARAKKARDHLELMAQYRRLLDLLPPLKPPARSRVITTSPPGSPVGGLKSFTWSSTTPAQQLGRKYNPLQYIRNKKVRARERMIIAGQRQGFEQVDNVKAWVQQCEQNVALQQSASDGAKCMVSFPGAEESTASSLSDSAAKAARNRRPRVDWFVEPCDLIADAYWIEQAQNKELIEDRLWRRIFPPQSELDSYALRENEQIRHGLVPYSPPDIGGQSPRTRNVDQAQKQHSPDRGLHRNPIERAREKLHHIKDPHTRPFPGHLHSRPRTKEESASEYSGTDTEARNRTAGGDDRNRPDITSPQSGDILHKQMLEMIAAENREKELSELSGIEHFVPLSMISPGRTSRSKTSTSRLQSRKNSFVDIGSENEGKNVLDRLHKTSSSRFHLGQHSPEHLVGLGLAKSVKTDSSLPTSPELLPSRKLTMESIKLELPTSWSRSGSPPKSPSAKSHVIPESRNTTGKGKHAAMQPQGAIKSPSQEFGQHIVPFDSGQPRTIITSAPLADGSIKGHRRMSSLRHRTDDGNSGIRAIFNRPRIDTVFRGRVSRIGDILRKKDGPGELQEVVGSTDESDSERAKGRRRPSRRDKHKTYESKHFLDVMPQFKQTSGASTDDEAHKSLSWAGRDIQTNDSSRLDLDRLPQAGLGSPSAPASFPPNDAGGRLGESDISDLDSAKGRTLNAGVRKTDDGAVAKIGDSTVRPAERSQRTASHRWSLLDPDARPVEQNGQLSRREIARIRTLVLSSGIKAMEINRRAREVVHGPFDRKSGMDKTGARLASIDWEDIAKLCPDRKHDPEVSFKDLYPLAADVLARNIQVSGQQWKMSVDRFTSVTGPELRRRVGGVRTVGEDMARLTREAADEADEISGSLALDQPLLVKDVVDMIDNMLRKKRHRLRWVRCGLWFSVEWLVVGFMWYVWFVVVVLRVLLGIGKGVWRGIKWVLWLS